MENEHKKTTEKECIFETEHEIISSEDFKQFAKSNTLSLSKSELAKFLGVGMDFLRDYLNRKRLSNGRKKQFTAYETAYIIFVYRNKPA